MKSKISIVVCTYNGENLIKNCLNSILSQNYKNFEIICVDGMSSDNTQKIIKEYIKKDKRIRLIINNKRLPEGKGYGKWLGYKNAKGKIFGIIDQDNVLQREDLFSKVKEIFNKDKNIAGILGGLTHDKKDKPITRFVALTGGDLFFAYRSIDFLRHIKRFENKDSCEVLKMNINNMHLTGGNCFFYLKKDLDKIEGYSQDILVINELVKKGFNQLVIMPNSTKHYAETSFFNLIKKKFKWGKTYHNSGEKFNYLPKTKKERKAFIKNLFFCLLIIPNFFYSIRLYKRTKDAIAFLFPIMAFFNTIAYSLTYLFHR